MDTRMDGWMGGWADATCVLKIVGYEGIAAWEWGKQAMSWTNYRIKKTQSKIGRMPPNGRPDLGPAVGM